MNCPCGDAAWVHCARCGAPVCAAHVRLEPHYAAVMRVPEGVCAGCLARIEGARAERSCARCGAPRGEGRTTCAQCDLSLCAACAAGSPFCHTLCSAEHAREEMRCCLY